MTKRCGSPKPTKRVVNPGTGPIAWCPGCKEFKPAAQVPWGMELRNSRNEIVASYAPISH